MSTPLEELFAATRNERAILIGYVPAGFPSKQGCLDVIKAMVDGGVDAIEIGFPYSDPVMDGPVIQAAAELSLSNGTGAKDVFDALEYAASLVPAVVMTYWNPIERFGVGEFAREVSARGGSGVITPDLTIEESAQWIDSTNECGVNRIYVVAPSTVPHRLAAVTAQTTGFIYAASLMGVTGTRNSLSVDAGSLVERIRENSTTPVAVGLGVSTGSQAAEVARYADGVIVGSAFIKKVQEAESLAAGLNAVTELAQELAAGVRTR